MIAIRFVELTGPVEAPSGVEGYDAVRFYCTVRGRILGHFTLWNKGHLIGRHQLLQEIGHQMGSTIARHFFKERFGGTMEPWARVEQLVRVQLGLEQREFSLPLSLEDEPELPKLMASITIPTRDRPEDIRRCLESLTNHKSRVPFEIIVADNNPASGLTEPVVRGFPGVVYLPEPRPGVTFARNAAALHAKGDIIICTDDDVTVMDGWLDNLIAPYADPEVMGVTGMVIPYELEHDAQYWFEIYGGLTRHFDRIRYDRNFYDRPPGYMPMVPAWDIGVTANASFRAEVFADPEVGPFDDELRIAEDPYLLYRMVKANRVVIFEPDAVVQHRHRASLSELARQLYNYGRSSTGLQLRTYFIDGDVRGIKCMWDIVKYDRDRLLHLGRKQKGFPAKVLALLLRKWQPNYVSPQSGYDDYPIELVVAETKGHLVGPFSLLKSIFQVRTKLGRYTPEQFALAQAARQRAKAAQAEQLEQANAIKQLAEPAEERQLQPLEVINLNDAG